MNTLDTEYDCCFHDIFAEYSQGMILPSKSLQEIKTDKPPVVSCLRSYRNISAR